MKMKMFLVLIFLLSTMTGLLCIPCNYKHPYVDSSWRKYDAWQCPRDELCIQKQDVCALPPFNIQRCPNGGDFGNDSCTEELCKDIGKVKCPFDPFCFDDNYQYVCSDCPHGAKNVDDCSEYST